MNKHVFFILPVTLFLIGCIFGGEAPGESTALSLTEDTSNIPLMDHSRSTALWIPAENALMQSLQTTPFQSTNRSWRRLTLDEVAYEAMYVAIGDLTNDGLPDIVSGISNGISRIYINKGGLSFTEGMQISSNAHATCDIILGDLNGDGFLDIIECNSNQNNLAYINGGNGSFHEACAYSGDVRDTRCAAVGDLNGDGRLDVVFGNYGSNCVYYLNKGDGDWGTALPLPGKALNTTSLLIMDLNEDNRPDIITGNWDQPLHAFLNVDNGRFAEGVDITDDTRKTNALAACDVNNDGEINIVTGNFGEPNRIYENVHGLSWKGRDASNDNMLTVDIALGDMDGDGAIDMITADSLLGFHLYLNDGSGNFSEKIALTQEKQNPVSIALGDLDGDGLLDVAAGNAGTSGCAYINRGCSMPYAESKGVVWGDNDTETTCITTTDINGDHIPDLVSGTLNRGILVYLGKKAGGFGEGTPINDDIRPVTALATADLDNDGLQDVVAGSMKQANRYYLNQGAFTWKCVDISEEVYSTTSIKTGDLNKDGFTDIVTGNLNSENQYFLNKGDGSFQAGVDITDDVFSTFAIALEDLNGDGYPDVVSGNYGATNRIYINTGWIHPFAGVSGVDIGGDANNTLSLAIGDINGDGYADVIAGNYDGTNRYYLNNGTTQPFEGAEGKDITEDKDKTFSTALFDMDSDGDLDVISGNTGQPIRLYLNNGSKDPFADVTGTSVTNDTYDTLSLIVEDIDKNGVAEIIAGFRNAANRIYEPDTRQAGNYTLPGNERATDIPISVGLPDNTNTKVLESTPPVFLDKDTPCSPCPHFNFNDNIALSPVMNYPNETIAAIKTDLKTNIAPNTGINFYVTNNGGKEWFSTQNGQTIFFPEKSNTLQWKAVFQSLTSLQSARILGIGLSIPMFTVTFEKTEIPGTMLQGETSQQVKAGGASTPVTAMGNEAYCFAQWMIADQQYTFNNPVVIRNTLQDTTLKAVFALKIHTFDELQRIGRDPDYPLDGKYCLANDLDASQTIDFVPIGSLESPFSGCLYGNGHTITGFKLSCSAEPYSGAMEPYNGLFRALGETAEVHDLQLHNVIIDHGGDYTGALAGNNDGLISNCHINGTLHYNFYASIRGALAGQNGPKGHIDNCSATATVHALGESIGGLVGKSEGALTGCLFKGLVQGSKHVGGMVGSQNGGALLRCRAFSDVQATAGNAGGLIGTLANAVLTQCFTSGATHTVTGAAGGIAGEVWTADIQQCFSFVQLTSEEGCAAGLVGIFNAGNLKYCYAAGPVAGPVAGGLLDYGKGFQPSVICCYWDVETTGQFNPTPSDTNMEGAEGKTTSELLCPQTYCGWQINSGNAFAMVEDKTYPYLRWAPPEVYVVKAEAPENDSAVFNIDFSQNIPGFNATDLKISCTGIRFINLSLAPEEVFPYSPWRAIIRTSGDAGIVNASVNIQNSIISIPSESTVFSGKPSDPGTTTIETNKITWTWKDNSMIEDCFISYFSPEAAVSESITTTLPANTVSQTIDGLTPNTPYVFQIAARHAGYESAKTEIVTAWTLAKIPAAPLLSNASVNMMEVSIRENDNNPPSTKYALHLTPWGDTGCWVQSNGVPGAEPAWNTREIWGVTRITGLTGATEYTVTAVAKNESGILTREGPGENIITYCMLGYSSGANGVISKTVGSIDYGHDGPVVTATPEPGYRFDQWSDGIRENPRQDKNITRNINAEALFVLLFNGQGTVDAPYEITDIELLQKMRFLLDKHFILKNDIDASITNSWNGGAGFQPVGTEKEPFIGTFDGNGHAISGLTIQLPTAKNVGLWGVVGPEGMILNTTLNAVHITANENTGGVAGSDKGGKISRCSVTGEVKGNKNVGGLTGYSESGTMEQCNARCAVTGKENVGGLAGFSENAVFDRDYAACTVEGTHNAGGITGYIYKCNISDCYSKSSVTGTWYTGGLVGYNHTGEVTRCYAAGSVSGSGFFGGLLAFNDHGKVDMSYWDIQMTGQETSHDISSVWGKSTEDMKRRTTFTDWNFDSIWTIRESEEYPKLQENPEHP